MANNYQHIDRTLVMDFILHYFQRSMLISRLSSGRRGFGPYPNITAWRAYMPMPNVRQLFTARGRPTHLQRARPVCKLSVRNCISAVGLVGEGRAGEVARAAAAVTTHWIIHYPCDDATAQRENVRRPPSGRSICVRPSVRPSAPHLHTAPARGVRFLYTYIHMRYGSSSSSSSQHPHPFAAAAARRRPQPRPPPPPPAQLINNAPYDPWHSRLDPLARTSGSIVRDQNASPSAYRPSRYTYIETNCTQVFFVLILFKDNAFLTPVRYFCSFIALI